MAEAYLHYSNARGVIVDRRGAAVSDLTEACDFAEGVVRSLVMTPNTEDWRSWVLHVSDNRGDESFVVPFASVLGKPH